MARPRLPRNVNFLTDDGQVSQLWLRYFESVASGAAGVAGSKIIRNWLPTDASFPASGYATLDTRNTHPVLDFSTGTANRRCFFQGVIPDNYDGEDIEVVLFMTMTSATSGNIIPSVRIENMSGLDITSDSFTAGYPNATVAVPSPAGTVFEATITMTGATLDSVAAGDPFRIEVLRDTPNRAGDTASGDIELHMVEMRIA
jgi:hypothetical protein